MEEEEYDENEYYSKKSAEDRYLKWKEKSERILKLVREGKLKTPQIDLHEIFRETYKFPKGKKLMEDEENV